MQTRDITKDYTYFYNSYRGRFQLDYNHLLLKHYLTKDGLTMLFSQVIKDDKDF